MLPTLFLVLLGARLGLATEATTAPAPVDAEGRDVRVAGVLVTRLEAPARAVLPMGIRVWVLGPTGTLELWEAGPTSGTPVYKLVSSVAMPYATSLFAAGGHVWAEIRETKAIPVDGASPATMASPGLPSAPAPSASAVTTGTPGPGATGAVLRTENGAALVNIGRKEGLQPNDLVRFLGKVKVEVPRLDGKGSEIREVERETAVGRVRVVEEDQALVDLGRGGRVSEGDRVERRTKGQASPVAPERFGGVGETGVVIRPLLALDTLGVAFIDEAWVTWSFEKPWYVSARLAPFGIGWSSDGNPLSISALATGGYEGRFFSVGLGAGWSMLNQDPSRSTFGGVAQEDGLVDQVKFEDVNNAFAIVQEARLGSRDGLYASVRNTFILYPEQQYVYKAECKDEKFTGDYSDCYEAGKKVQKFNFGGIAMRFGIPVGDRTDLLVDWGTGAAGATWVEGGVATWLRGNGDKGSLGLEVGAGYGSLTGEPNNESVTLAGPLVSVGARWRW
jgi:hypothetical protein